MKYRKVKDYNYYQVDPIEFLNVHASSYDISHIKVGGSKYGKYEICITKTFSHDGTLLFEINGILEVLSHVVVKDLPIEGNYVVSNIRILSKYGLVDLKCGRYPGTTQMIRVSVKGER